VDAIWVSRSSSRLVTLTVRTKATGVGHALLGVALWGLHMGLTQGLFAALVADTAPARLRGTAFGIFNLAGGAAMLVASVLAGWLWARYGAPATFYAGALFTVVALGGLARPPGRGWPSARPRRSDEDAHRSP